MKVLYVKKSLCPCGFPVLSDGIPLGKVYDVEPIVTEPMTLICGGCKQEIKVKAIWVYGELQGFLPSEIFDLDSKQLAE